ncbi:hypothetical protein MMC10_005709 [Thelotrema lepadinum]|nr:hypothetical protein [Thelotrema lepadinum]
MSRPQTSFHTKGERFSHNNSYIIVNQAYVQYMPPATIISTDASFNLPVLFVHGGGLTGACWEATPDRRPGWALLATRAPHLRPVYLIDAVDSGRSQQCPSGLRSAPLEHRTAEEMWERFRFGPPQDFNGDSAKAVPYVEAQFPMQAYDALVAGQSARRRGYEQYQAEIQGLRDAIKEIGQCQIIAHSNGAATTHVALQDGTVAKLVNKFVMIEPGFPATADSEAVPLETRTLVVLGDYLERYDFWEDLIKKWKAVIDSESLRLPDKNLRGNSHFPMSDRNSDQVFEKIIQWLNG